MVNRVIVFILLPCMILALFLSFAGVQQVSFDNSYYVFLNSLSHSYESWKLEIPKVPTISAIQQNDFDRKGGILDILIKIGNFFVFIINALIESLNIAITIVNVLINIIQFVLTFIWNIKSFIDSLRGELVIAYV